VLCAFHLVRPPENVVVLCGGLINSFSKKPKEVGPLWGQQHCAEHSKKPEMMPISTKFIHMILRLLFTGFAICSLVGLFCKHTKKEERLAME
jgi:hypothetical protein